MIMSRMPFTGDARLIDIKGWLVNVPVHVVVIKCCQVKGWSVDCYWTIADGSYRHFSDI